MGTPRLTVILPALDEADGILMAIDDAEGALDELVERGLLSDYEVLVVDDGSRDGTGRAVADRASRDDRVRALAHRQNRGVGSAFRTALDAATGDLVLYTDADMPVDLRDLERALPLLGRPEVGMVAGQRRGSRRREGARGMASKGYDLMAWRLLGVRERDVNFPFKLLAPEVARALDLRAEGALVDAEMLVRVRDLGLEVVQITLDYRPRLHGESKTMSPHLLTQLAREMITQARRMRGRAGTTGSRH